MAHIPKFPPDYNRDWAPGNPSKFQPPLPRCLWNPEWEQWVGPEALKRAEETSSTWGAHRGASMLAQPDINKLSEFSRSMYERMMGRLGYEAAPVGAAPAAPTPEKAPAKPAPEKKKRGRPKKEEKEKKEEVPAPAAAPAAPATTITGISKLTPDQEAQVLSNLSEFYEEEGRFPGFDQYSEAVKREHGVELTSEDYEKLKAEVQAAE